ncbi:hypothetical protein K2173_004501 [Erythroxylum novogranatense]|uniref:FF domain-containing protein n=1 Tax=Erythroxylum novogranatense TaxID=1862640 RepID=A0AAV8TID7_9ROSI|nr:hypothetical protein K2173_004501 [Erythroxylum novogranatense]
MVRFSITVNSRWRKIQDRLEDDERCLRLEKLDRLLAYQVNSQWRKIQDRLEDDERCLRLEKLDRLLAYHEKMRRTERKNHDAFRKMMEEHIAAGALIAQTRWQEYCLKEKEKAAEEHKQHLAEYRKFLESCDFIKVNSQWRKIQDRLEDDERCLRLEKLDRLLAYQEKMRRTERKNHDAFRKMMEEHIAAGALIAQTRWQEYCLKYHDDETQIKDAMNSGKITMLSTWTFEDFRSATSDDIGSPTISDINLKLLCEELVERAKEKEEKEAKKRQRLADEFTKVLQTRKVRKIYFGNVMLNAILSLDYFSNVSTYFVEKAIEEDSLKREGFEEYIAHLQEKAKEKERKREEKKVVDFGEGGPIRCFRWKGFTDETPSDYHCNLGPDGRRRDVDERPELCRGMVEFVATKEYMVREPMEAVYFFLVDVSMNAIQPVQSLQLAIQSTKSLVTFRWV